MSRTCCRIHSWVLAVLLALPIVGVLGLAAGKQLFIMQGVPSRVSIVGYDPINLMYGHYLHFRFSGLNAPDDKPHDYFVPEDAAPALDRMLSMHTHSLSIDVLKTPNGGITFGALYIENVPWRNYLDAHVDEGK